MDKEVAVGRRKRCSVKWLRRIGFAILLLALLPAAVWLFLPWYAQSLIDRALAGKPFRIEVSGMGLPDFSGVKFCSMRVLFVTPPDGCSDAATYTLLLTDGLLSWHFENPETPATRTFLPQALNAAIILKADSLNLKPESEEFVFGDRKPKIAVSMAISRMDGINLSIKPLSATCTIDQATVTSGNLRLEGVNFNARLSAAEKWQQPRDTVRVAKLFRDGKPMPVNNFKALFGSKRDPVNPCTLMFTDCSADLFGWKATTEQIAFDLKEKSSRFTLSMVDIPLAKLPGFGGGGLKTPFAVGRVSGVIPIEFRDSILIVRNAEIFAEKGTNLLFYTRERKPYISFNMGGGDVLKNLDARIVFNSQNENFSGLAVSSLSATLFGGKVTSTPVSFKPSANTARLTLKFDNVNALDRVRLHGDFRGSLKGQINGTLPLTIANGGFSIRNAQVKSFGSGRITFAPSAIQKSAEKPFFGRERADADYTFSEPELLINRSFNGATAIDFSLKNVLRQTDGGELLLLSPKGKLMLLHNRKNLDIASLSDFSAGLFGGRVAVEHIDYDMAKKRGETTLQLNNIPLQKLLDLQGTSKLYATGNVMGNIPIKMSGELFEITNGGVNAEQSGQIIYATTPEERAAANQGLRVTYEALSNFLYAELLSSINMAPDGNSVITIRLKGSNPEFQGGRPVELNLKVEQNLLDLMHSLSIASNIEQSISEKALHRQKK